MNSFRFNLLLFVVCFLLTIGFTIASILSENETLEIFALTFGIMTLYEFGYVLGFYWGHIESEK